MDATSVAKNLENRANSIPPPQRSGSLIQLAYWEGCMPSSASVKAGSSTTRLAIRWRRFDASCRDLSHSTYPMALNRQLLSSGIFRMTNAALGDPNVTLIVSPDAIGRSLSWVLSE